MYQKLTGRRRSIAGFSQLWLAPDHILMVDSSRFVERYRRFALSDVQAIVVTGLPARTPWQIAALGLSILWTLAAFTAATLFLKIVIGVSGALAVALSIADIAAGPRCLCHLQTAVSRELLAPVSRLRVADRFLARVRPAIEAVQGPIAPDQIAAASVSDPSEWNAPPPVAHAPGYLPETLFAVFLLNAVLVALMHFRPYLVDNILPTTFFGEFVILVIAVIRRANRDPRRVVYVLMLAALLFMGHDAFQLVRSFGGYMGVMMEQSRHGRAVVPTFEGWAMFDRDGTILAVAWRAAIGVAGLIAAWMERPAPAA